MTLWNYDKEAGCCREEAAGPIDGLPIQMMRAWACSGNLARREGRGAEATARPGHRSCTCQTDLRRPGLDPRPEPLQGGRRLLTNCHPGHCHGVAEKPWGNANFPHPTRSKGHRWSACVYEHWSELRVRAGAQEQLYILRRLLLAGCGHIERLLAVVSHQ
ncbi:hypothetical protein GMOD_00001047 [Pyrenophora seminiperda CCB06]|uniref:Uncharacterized protein n=1 Tax=Pyrenophora seminiperda CCB06 TaxID=1302712 RepID=A0A3M7LYE9_9PLEO|nr:hypothetical protein GMOD_00001047 [Pyrenophora seminiperda CCB06]